MQTLNLKAHGLFCGMNNINTYFKVIEVNNILFNMYCKSVGGK